MDCFRASECMMQFMDNILIKEDAILLGEHLNECPSCKEDFVAYDSIMSHFAELDMVCAPDGFEVEVMQKVEELLRNGEMPSNSIENMICKVWGSISLLFGFGFLIALNSTWILECFYNTPELAAYADTLVLTFNNVKDFTTSFNNLLNSSVALLFEYLYSSRYILLLIFAVLAAAQYILGRRSRIGI